jgi:hypothetical protein
MDAYHAAAITTHKWRGNQLARFIETGVVERMGRPLPKDPEVERLVAQINAGGTLKIDAEGRPYVES